MSPVFEWDNRKAKSNFRKHRVQFTEGGLGVQRSTGTDFYRRGTLRERGPRDHYRALPSRWWIISALLAPAARRIQKNAIMKNISQSRIKTKRENGLRAEYRFDYSK